MPITINGTTVTINRMNGTSISSETVNGTRVYGGILIKVWVYIYETTSVPNVDLGILESSDIPDEWLNELTLYWSPNDYAVGTTASVWDGYTTYYTYQIQEINVTPRVWVLIYLESTQPQTDLGIIESSNSQSNWINELTVTYPPNNYPVGTTAAMWDGYFEMYYVYQIQEE